MAYTVPFVNAREHYKRYKSEFENAIIDTLSRGDLVMRGQLRDFEQQLADFCGVKFAVGVASGYHALHLSMLAAGVKPGDEVITVAHTFVATISAIVHCGATPVLVEVGNDYNMDPDAFARAITPRTRAVVPVHLNGRVSEMALIMEIARKHNLVVIEDAAQALGATFAGQRAGSFGLTGCFSFYPFKILGCFGDGGAVTTNDPDVARAVTLLRYNGEDRQTGEYHYHGYTALLDNVQAAVLSVKLRHLPAWIEHRQMIATRYHERLAGVGDVRLPNYTDGRYMDAFQNYVIRTGRRDALRKHLADGGVETLVHWAKPVWEHGALGLANPELKNTEAICREVISLPMSAETTVEQVDVVAVAVRNFFA
ncbi:MAG TPA: DegT/DnrJ/EryC1/StrS family aminotransferase [Vicinamibacterales bacterium]|nr:DegT/DnrJ/EryC1/StrS family aminotransferase [Vicinamibacterales bacterium]